MNNDYKQVLWVEGNAMIYRDYQKEALKYGLNLVTFDCWDDAYTALVEDFGKWSAIILQPKSKLHPGSIRNIMQFLPQAFSDINVLCATKGKTIPWYLLTTVRESDFADLVLESRDKWDSAWPKPYYDSSIEDERFFLFKRIKDQTQQDERLQVRTGQYKNVFDALEYLLGHNLNSEVREIMENLLVSTCFGNGGLINIGVIREVLEYIFHSMIMNKMLPSDLKNISNRINNNACCRLLSGLDTDVCGKKYRVVVPIMNKIMSQNIYNILNLGNNGKHAVTDDDTKQLEEYLTITNTNNLLNSCALQLCDIIIWYEKAVKDIEQQIHDNGKVMQWWYEFDV